MPFEREILVRFQHCDPAGIMFYPRYFEFFNQIVEDWFAEGLGMSFQWLHLEKHVGTPTIHAECDFLRPSRVGDVLRFTLRLISIGRSSFTFLIDAFAGSEHRIKGKAVLVCTTLGEVLSTIEMPEFLRQSMEPFLETA